MVARKFRVKLVLKFRSERLADRQIAGQGMPRTSVVAVIEAADLERVGWDDVADLEEAGRRQ